MKYRVIDLSPELVPGKEERRLEIRPYIYEPDNTTMCEIDMVTSHATLLGNDIPIVERLTNLEKVKAKRIFSIALPLFIEGLDSSPVRAVALEKEE